jgi:tetratricopeptide (TPR) repeat protein
LSGPTGAQVDIERSEGALIDQQPYDLITLTADAGAAQVKVFPIPFPNRQVPSNPKSTDKLEVVLVKFPDREYEVMWKNIDRIDLYEQRIYDEALQKMEEKDFINAFQNLSFLMKNYPEMPRLEQLRQEFLLKSAADRYQAGEYRQTLSALEELRATAPGYQSATVTSVLSRVADSLIDAYRQGGDLASAKALLNRLTKQYGPNLGVVVAWKKKLETMALAKRDEAVNLMGEKKYRQARQAAIDMLSILPDLKEGQQLITEINRVHPMVRVGVMQRSGTLDPTSLVNWPARRAGGLVYQPLFQFLETGAEGGRYGFALGSFRISDDRQQLILSLDPNIQPSLSAFELTQLLLERADPQNAAYDPSWAAIFESVSSKSSTQVIVQLKRPNVLPHALLQWIFPDAPPPAASLPGDYRLAVRDGRETSFTIRDEGKTQGQPVEIIEIFYDDPRQAVNDLLRGDIDVLDQLYPADAQRLAIDPRLRIGSYALPTTHMLIPVSKHEYLSNSKFRRALLYATNREAMLVGELLNSKNLNDGRLISGPFPIGSGESDPLAYAYNPDIQPTEYSPQLARLLLVMTQQELREKAKKRGEPEPSLEKLVVGCPDFEFARVAVQAMIQQWMNVGIQAEMLVLPPEETFSQDCDLIYVTTTMWEPATDIERLLGGNGIASTDNPFIVQALERLRASRNWREVRTAMQDLHQLVDYHLPVLPLWQITDRFAVRRYVDGLEDRPVSLYQDITAWRINLGQLQTAQR